MSYFIYGNRNEGLAETARYFTPYFNSELQYKDKAEKSDTSYPGNFFCYPAFDVAFAAKHSRRIDEFIKRGFCGKTSGMKSLIRNAYRLCAMLTFPKSAAGVYRISPPPENPENIMIFPNNKKVKVVDFGTDIITNILKKDYGDIWYNREVRQRSNTKLEYILPLTVTGDHIYQERFVEGYTVARIRKKELERYSSRIKEMLCYFGGIDRRESTYAQYAAELMKQYTAYEDILGGRVDLTHICQKFVKLTEKLSGMDGNVILSFSHGDVQRGNIFIENKTGALWLLDWETYGIRSTAFDDMTYRYGLRNKAVQTGTFEKILRDDDMTVCTLPGGHISGEGLKAQLMIYLLEDMLFQLDETATLRTGTADALSYYNGEAVDSCLCLLGI